VGLVKGNFGNIVQVGYAGATENNPVVRYSGFKNMMYIGA
jgi:hypothetical protein